MYLTNENQSKLAPKNAERKVPIVLLRNALISKTIRRKNLFRNSDFFIYAMNVMRDFDLEILIRYENLSVKDSRVKQAEEAFLVDAFKRNSWVFKTHLDLKDAPFRRFGIENVYAIATLVQLSHGLENKFSYIDTLLTLTKE